MEDRWAVRRKAGRWDVAKLARPQPVAARGLRASFPMPIVNTLGIYVNPSPLFVKLTKLQIPNAKPLDKYFEESICKTVGNRKKIAFCRIASWSHRLVDPRLLPQKRSTEANTRRRRR
jgi:hypothetical protein